MGKNQNTIANETPVVSTIFDGIKRTASTTIFESTEIKDSLATMEVKTKKGIKKVIPPEVIKAHTLTVEFDFTGLTIDECVDQLVSTTSFMKLFQNNIIGNTDKRWTEAEILDTISKGVYHVTCRSLLDDRTRRESDPTIALKNAAIKMKAKGMTNEQIMEQLLTKLNS